MSLEENFNVKEIIYTAQKRSYPWRISLVNKTISAVTFTEDRKSVKDDQEVANIFNSLFVNTASNTLIYYPTVNRDLKIETFGNCGSKIFENHGSIVAIKDQ